MGSKAVSEDSQTELPCAGPVLGYIEPLEAEDSRPLATSEIPWGLTAELWALATPAQRVHLVFSELRWRLALQEAQRFRRSTEEDIPRCRRCFEVVEAAFNCEDCAVVSLLCERCMRFHRRVHHERVAADE